MLTEDYFNKFATVVEDFCATPGTVIMERKFGYEIGNKIFNYGHTFMMDNLVGSADGYRALDFDIGVLPFPKYDADQENYCSNINEACATAYSVPAGNDAEKAGLILDAMGYYSADTVTESVIEKNILVKGVRDEESYDMFKIIFASKTYELSYVFGWGNFYGNTIINMIFSGKNTLASAYEKVAPKANAEIAAFIEQITAEDG